MVNVVGRFAAGVFFIGQFQNIRRHPKPLTQFAFDIRQTAGDVPFGMSEHGPDAIKGPPGVFT